MAIPFGASGDRCEHALDANLVPVQVPELGVLELRPGVAAWRNHLRPLSYVPIRWAQGHSRSETRSQRVRDA